MFAVEGRIGWKTSPAYITAIGPSGVEIVPAAEPGWPGVEVVHVVQHTVFGPPQSTGLTAVPPSDTPASGHPSTAAARGTCTVCAGPGNSPVAAVSVTFTW